MSNSIEMLHQLDSENDCNDHADSKAVMTYKDKSIYNLLQRSRKVGSSESIACSYICNSRALSFTNLFSSTALLFYIVAADL